MDVWLSMDLGATHLRQALYDSQGQLLAQEKALLPKALPQLWLGDLAKFWRGFLGQVGREAWVLRGLGLAAANGNYFTGCVERPANLAWPVQTPLRAWLSEAFGGLPVVLDNDANAAAWGEWRYGYGFSDMIFITIGTGLGSGLMVDNRLCRGRGQAGELGHVRLYPQGWSCGCGRLGCAEAYVSGRGLLRLYRELGPSTVVDSSEAVVARAAAGESRAVQAIEQMAEHLALLLSNSMTYTQPRAFVLDGGVVAGTATWLFPALRRFFQRDLLSVYASDEVLILPSRLPWGQAALLGALALVQAELGV